ncbi:Mediator of RNA polymerase II transcription subunit [Sesamum angolense]|uniref:Mediator of RNA polymerase II transcription subunit n=1 Tax=Sesamum angolense TaxID=2727404 RepID=A0AAE2BRG2_9LAMI|nr:Mediator of RNA polymerase II transcription subunit [Sesamum angolense]
MEHFGGGNWSMIPNIQSHSNPATPSNQDHLFLQQQQFNQQQQQQFQQFNQQQQQQPRFQQQPQQQQQHQSLASHFQLLHLVENLADVTENGTRDQQTDALTVEGQKHKLEETENLLAQRSLFQGIEVQLKSLSTLKYECLYSSFSCISLVVASSVIMSCIYRVPEK